LPSPAPPSTTGESAALDQLKSDFRATHHVWRSRVADEPVGYWYATLRREPKPFEAGNLFRTVCAPTDRKLRSILDEQAAIARRGEEITPCP
jgi:hypothetical protein